MRYFSYRNRRRTIAQLKYKTGIASPRALEKMNAKFEGVEIGEDNRPYEIWRASDGTPFKNPLKPVIEPGKIEFYYAPTRDQLPYYKFRGAQAVVQKISNAEFINQTEVLDRKGQPCKINHYVDMEGKKFHMAEEEINKKFKYYYEHKDEFIDKAKDL